LQHDLLCDLAIEHELDEQWLPDANHVDQSFISVVELEDEPFTHRWLPADHAPCLLEGTCEHCCV
jgi:hypothetical protein